MIDSGCRVITYHYVRDPETDEYPNLNSLNKNVLIQQLVWMQESCPVVSVDEFESRLMKGEPAPDKEHSLLTFDDGLIDHFEIVYPILKGRGMTALFYVSEGSLLGHKKVLNVHKLHFLIAKVGYAAVQKEVTEMLVGKISANKMKYSRDVYQYDFEEERVLKQYLNYELDCDQADSILGYIFRRHFGDESKFAQKIYLGPEHIKEMASNGMRFGYHTINHRVLSRLSLDSQALEIKSGLDLVKDCTGQKSVSFCYPYGRRESYNDLTLEILEQSGYSYAFNIDRRVLKYGDETNRFELPRLDTRDLIDEMKLQADDS